MVQAPSQTYTLAAYREFAETAEERYEFHDGHLIPMTGGTLDHSAISGNLYALLKRALKGTPTKPFNSDLRIWVPRRRRGLYADVLTITGEPQFNGDRRDEILNPQLIAEVLSPSTEARDRGEKFWFYRSIPSFCEYLLVAQDRPLIEQYVKTNTGDWLLRSREGLAATIPLAIAEVTLNAADIYEDIQFPPSVLG